MEKTLLETVFPTWGVYLPPSPGTQAPTSLGHLMTIRLMMITAETLVCCSLKGLECVFTATAHQATNLPRTGTPDTKTRTATNSKTVSPKSWPVTITEASQECHDL